MNDLAERVKELAGIAPSETPVVSVYLDAHWKDEQQRERTRVFLKNELAKARDSAGGAHLAVDLDWIRGEAETLIGRQRTPDVLGVALFAGWGGGGRRPRHPGRPVVRRRQGIGGAASAARTYRLRAGGPSKRFSMEV